MLKQLIVAVGSMLLIAAHAAPEPVGSVAEAQAKLAEKCSQGCLILSPADVTEFEAAVNAFARRAYQAGGQAGYQKGVEDLAAAAAANPKICPKNI